MTNKTLILYATAGAGHKKAAEAIFRAAKDRSIDAELIDINGFMPPLARRLYADGYALLITRLVWLWTILYHVSDTPALSLLNIHARRFMNARMCRQLVAFLKDRRPETIISTHFLASEIVSYAKIKHGLETKLITVITDFQVHNFWLAPKTDIYCCATEVTRKILLEKGIEPNLIKVTGIPVDPKFLRGLDRDQVFAELGVQRGLFTVLLVTGGLGAGPMEEIVELLKDDVQLLVVCGNNKGLLDRLSQKKYGKVRLFGFVDYMQKLMKISDLIITKAGGLTITESLVMGLPLVFFYLLPGQEANNAKTISQGRAGVIATTLEQIKEEVLKFKEHRDIHAAYQNAALSLARPDSCAEIIAACQN